MAARIACIVLCALSVTTPALAQRASPTLKAAVVALTEDRALRESFERELVALARTHDYDAVTSYDIAADVRDVGDDAFIDALKPRGVQVVLIVRPAAVGEGSSLEAVRNDVSPRLLANMQRFARRISDSGANDLIAVVHLGIYMITAQKPELISSGAVWLDEPVTDRAQGIERLQRLILENVNAVRPAIRQHLGLPPLP